MSNKKMDGKNMINFYKLDKVKKYLPKDDDEQYQFTGCKIFKHILFVAPTGGGKTNALMNYILLTSEPKKGTFDHIFLCYETDEVLYEVLKDSINKKTITFIKGVENMPDVRVFKDQVANEKLQKYLVIFDDCVNEISKVQRKKIEDYFKIGRKKGITLAFLSQRYYDTSKFVRAQVSYVFLAGLGNKDIAPILKDASLDLTKEQLVSIFNYATKPDENNDMPMLKITKIVCPKNVKFARNFTDYIDISAYSQ